LFIIVPPDSSYEKSLNPDNFPAELSIYTSHPWLFNFFTASGVAETLLSPELVSEGISIYVNLFIF